MWLIIRLQCAFHLYTTLGSTPLAVRATDPSEVIPFITLSGADTFIPFRVLRLLEEM